MICPNSTIKITIIMAKGWWGPEQIERHLMLLNLVCCRKFRHLLQDSSHPSFQLRITDIMKTIQQLYRMFGEDNNSISLRHATCDTTTIDVYGCLVHPSKNIIYMRFEALLLQ